MPLELFIAIHCLVSPYGCYFVFASSLNIFNDQSQPRNTTLSELLPMGYHGNRCGQIPQQGPYDAYFLSHFPFFMLM